MEDKSAEGEEEEAEEEIVWEGQLKSLNLLSLVGLTSNKSFHLWWRAGCCKLVQQRTGTFQPI